MTRDRLTDLIIARLLRDHGHSKHHWRAAIGTIRLYDRATHAHCNWNATPTGSARDVAVIERLLDELRMTYPLLTG